MVRYMQCIQKKKEKLGIETEGKEQITLEKEIHETEVGRKQSS